METAIPGISTSSREIVGVRTFNFPRELVFKAWSDAEHLARWWGPNGFTNTVKSFDFRVGGIWDFTMHGPDGADYPNRIVYTEITPPERIAYDHTNPTDEALHFKAEVEFKDLGGRTELTMTMTFTTAEELRRIAEEVGAMEGLSQTLGRLEAYVGSMQD